MILSKNLGFSAFIDDQDKIDEIVEIIMKRFDLIMISDYMDESQVSMNLARALDVLIDTGSKSDFAKRWTWPWNGRHSLFYNK